MSHRLHILEAWNNYREMVVPKDASETQLIECRRAFYAGADAMFFTVVRTLPDEGAEERLTDLEAELRHFCERVKAGAA